MAHESFKSIKKDVQKISDMVDAAQNLDIELDPVLHTEV